MWIRVNCSHNLTTVSCTCSSFLGSEFYPVLRFFSWRYVALWLRVLIFSMASFFHLTFQDYSIHTERLAGSRSVLFYSELWEPLCATAKRPLTLIIQN
ncbi:hypothetical protein BU16DRAFT_15293 [Lophium mytilinum]|uniref:Uncharacterized protein n=1 Tax=Lophium mytilinum TaxID=390894 RepID=A0A6A6RDV2_9PEZI|nr:hypothetical protein BU16DRAFT_15293 [Lophium mytilinum]